MKQILILGVCALFVACSNSTEKTSDSDTVSAIVADTNSIVSATDTISSIVTPSDVPQSPEVKVSVVKKPEVKKPEPAGKENQPASTSKPAESIDNQDAKKGEILITKSDCFACHKLQDKLLGPSYKDVANKYDNTKANIDYLANKIKTGGSGVWGAIPMSPHPSISDDDAKAMVKYILTIR